MKFVSPLIWQHSSQKYTLSPSSRCMGMIDPYINEIVTYVAEPDEEAIRREIMLPPYCFLIPNLIIGLFCPIFCIIPLIIYCCVRRYYKSSVEGTKMHLTEHTLVYVEGGRPTEYGRLTIPLANIASVIVQPPDTIINIKPTAPEVLINRIIYTTADDSTRGIPTTVATCSVPIPNVKNAEHFAKVIRRVLIQ